MSKEPNRQMVLAMELGSLLGRWWWTIVAGAALGLTAGILYYHFATKTYAARTRILVTPPQISQDYIRSTVTDDMSVRLKSLKESLISRPYLMRLAGEMLEDVPEEAAARDRLLGKIGGRVSVWVDRIDTKSGTGMFSLSYADEDPKMAAQMANKLAELYIQENTRQRTSQAESNAETFKVLAEEWAVKKQAQQKKINRYKSQNLHVLSGQQDTNLKLMEAARSNLEIVGRDIKDAQNQLDVLEAKREQEQRLAASGQPVLSSGGGGDASPADDLRLLQNQLNLLELRYKSSHPDVIAKKKEIENLIAREGLDPDVLDGDGETPIEMLTEVEIEIRNTRSNIALLRERQTTLEQDIAEYQSRLRRAPAVDQRLAELTEGFDEIRSKHSEYEGKYQDALGSLRVEENRKGEQFEIMEKAAPPSVPTSPNAQSVYLSSTGTGLAILICPMLLRRLLSPTVVSEAGLRAMSEIPVLVSISEIPSAAAKRARTLRFAWNLFASVATVAVLLVTVTNYTSWLAR